MQKSSCLDMLVAGGQRTGTERTKEDSYNNRMVTFQKHREYLRTVK